MKKVYLQICTCVVSVGKNKNIYMVPGVEKMSSKMSLRARSKKFRVAYSTVYGDECLAHGKY